MGGWVAFPPGLWGKRTTDTKMKEHAHPGKGRFRVIFWIVPSESFFFSNRGVVQVYYSKYTKASIPHSFLVLLLFKLVFLLPLNIFGSKPFGNIKFLGIFIFLKG